MHQALAGASGSIIIALPAAVNCTHLLGDSSNYNNGYFRFCPKVRRVWFRAASTSSLRILWSMHVKMFLVPYATLVRSLYQVVEAQGRPLRVGGQPSHRDSRGDSGWSQDDSPNTWGDARARQNTSTNIVKLCVMVYRKDNVNETDLDPYHHNIVLLRCLYSKGCLKSRA